MEGLLSTKPTPSSLNIFISMALCIYSNIVSPYFLIIFPKKKSWANM